MRGDIISRRGEASPVNVAGNRPILGLGIVALSKGRATQSDKELSHTTSYRFQFANTSGWLIRGINYITESKRGLTYFPGTHFQVKDTSTTPESTITSYSNFAPQDNPGNISFDFSGAPLLSQPSITGHSIGSGGLGTTTSPIEDLKYYVVYVDAEGKESLPSQEEYIGDVSNASVTIYFTPEPYAKLIRIYRYSSGGGLQYIDVEQYDPEHSPGGSDLSDVFTTTSFTDNGSLSWTSAVDGLPTAHEARQIPDHSLTDNDIIAKVIENDLTELQVKEYYRAEDVYYDHAPESEVGNIARILFDLGIPSVIISPVPYRKKDNSDNYTLNPGYTDFVEAVDALDGQNIMFFGTTYYDNNLLQYAESKAVTLSNKVTGQKERYFIYSLEGREAGVDETEAMSLMTTIKSIESGKRVWVFMVDGGYATVNYWRDWDNSDEYDTRVYSLVNSKDITPMILAFAAVARYISFNDPAESMTNKDISGFKLPGNLSPVIVAKYTEMGYSVVTAESGTSAPYVDTAVLPSRDISLEDGDVSIRVTEDIMDMQIRAFLATYRGRKSLDKVLMNLRSQLIRKVLNGFVLREWILEFDPDTVTIERDPTNPSRIRGYFRYRPMYPITQLWVEHEFIV